MTASSSFFDAAPLQSSFARAPRSGPFGRRPSSAQWSLSITCLGFFPSSRHHRRAATSRETSRVPLRSVLRLSHPLDGLLRTPACELVSSRCHVQGSLCSGASLSAQPPFLIGRSLPPCRCFTVASPARPHFRGDSRAPTCAVARLRGLDPREAAFHESGYSPRPQPLPSSVSSPPGPFLLSTSAPSYSAHSAHGVFRLGLHGRARLAVCAPAASVFRLRQFFASAFRPPRLTITSLVHLQRLVIASISVELVSDSTTLLEFSSRPSKTPVARKFQMARLSALP